MKQKIQTSSILRSCHIKENYPVKGGARDPIRVYLLLQKFTNPTFVNIFPASMRNIDKLVNSEEGN